MTCPVRRGKDDLPLGCWQPLRTVAWVAIAVLALVYLMAE